jgi:hypothetical protein
MKALILRNFDLLGFIGSWQTAVLGQLTNPLKGA